MGYTTFICPHCEKKNKQPTNEWMYGSPIRVCRNCGKKYL